MKKTLLNDNNGVRENTASILKFADYDVVQAANAKGCLELLSTENPDLILCDVMMPIANGYQVLETLQR